MHKKQKILLGAVAVLIAFFCVSNLGKVKNDKVFAAATEDVAVIRQDCTGYTTSPKCYTSLSAWEAAWGGVDYTACENGNLVCADKIAVARIEGTWTSADTAAVTIDGWTTGSNNYIKIYTAPEARHAGVWEATRYRIVSSETSVLRIEEEYVRIEGLQIEATTFSENAGFGISGGKSGGDVYVSHNIIRHAGGTAGQSDGVSGIYLPYNALNLTYKVWNNIIYGFNTGIRGGLSDGDNYLIYNNTVSAPKHGIDFWGGISNPESANLKIKNNITQGVGTCTAGEWWVCGNIWIETNGTKTFSNNISQDGSSPDAAFRNNIVVFEDGNYKLSLLDTKAREAGADLSSEFPSVVTDIIGTTRNGIWDIGAYEMPAGSPPPPLPDTTPPVVSGGSPAGTTLSAGTTSTTISVTTDENSTCKYSTTAGTAYASMANTFSTTGATSHSTTVSGLTYGNYNYYVRCQDASGNPSTSDYAISFSVATPPDTLAPSVPTNLSATPISVSQINLNWTASIDNYAVIGYKIYRNGAQITTTSNTNYSDTGLTQSTTYSYTVSAYDSTPNNSAQSSSVSATTFTPGVANMSVWAIGDSDKVKPDGTIATTISTNPYYANQTYKNANDVWNGANVNLKAAKNEVVAFQTIIGATGGDLNNVNVKMSDLTNGSNTIASTSVELFKELYITTIKKSIAPDSQTNTHLDPGEYPDALLPLYPPTSWIRSGYTAESFAYFNVVNNRHQPIWVDVTVPKNIPAGTYTGVLTITSDSAPTRNITVNLNVWNFEISDRASLDHFWDMYPVDFERMFNYPATGSGDERAPDASSKWWEIMKEFFIMAHKHRAQLLPRFSPRLYADNNGNALPISIGVWNNFDATYGTVLDGTLFGDNSGGNTIWRVISSGPKDILWPIAPALISSYKLLPTLANEPDDEKYYNFCGDGLPLGCSAGANPTKEAKQISVRASKQYIKDLTTSGAALFVQHFASKTSFGADGWFTNKKIFNYVADEPAIEWSQIIEDLSQATNIGSGGKIKSLMTRFPFPMNPLYLTNWNRFKMSGPDMWTRTHAIDGQTHWQFPNWVGNSKTKVDIFAGTLFTAESNPYVIENVEYALSKGADMWFYNGGEPVVGWGDIDTDGLAFRSWSWVARKYGVTGTYFWKSNAWDLQTANPNPANPECPFKDPFANQDAVYTNPWAGDCSIMSNGGGFQFYPGYQKGLNGPVASFRMKSQRRGEYDYEYMKKLSDLGDGNFAKTQIDGVVQKALNEYLTPTTLTADASVGATTITVANSAQILYTGNLNAAVGDAPTPLKLINAITGESEDVYPTNVSGNVVTLTAPLHFSYKSGDRVSLMAVKRFGVVSHNLDSVGKWSRDPRQWENARVAMANQILYLQGGGTVVDSASPSAVSNLSVTGTGINSANLSWVSPGDDGTSGTANFYILRYSTSPITEANWASAADVVSEPTPLSAGTIQTMTVSGLLSNTKYYFALKTTDEASNISSLSNVSFGTTLSSTGDAIPPSAISTLSSTNVSQTSLTLTWTAPGDDANVGTANSYIVKYSLSPINAANFDSASNISNPPSPSLAGSSEILLISSNSAVLTANRLYYFALKTTDESSNISSISNIYSTTTLSSAVSDNIHPSTTHDLRAGGPFSLVTACGAGSGMPAPICTSTYSFDLKWTAPGDDGTSGTTNLYIIRYSTSTPISDANWDNPKIANDVSNEPTPSLAEVTQSMTINGLRPSSNFYFALKAFDEANNPSMLSNIYSTTTPALVVDTTAPSAITTLRPSAVDQTSVVLTWTATGDDNNTGTSTSYDIRYSTSTITASNWNSATQTNGEPEPKTSGTIQGATIVGLEPNTIYYFAIKSTDESGNTSAISNFATGKTQPTDFTVSFGSNVVSGTSPLKVNLTATVKWSNSCNAVSSLDYDYTFYCDRNDSGTNVTTPYSKQIPTSKSASESYECNYTTPGTYTAKIVINRGVLKTQNTRTIVVGSTAPSVSVPLSTGGGDTNTCVIAGTEDTNANTNTYSPGGSGGPTDWGDNNPPSKPSDFKAAGDAGKIILSWKNPTDFDFTAVYLVRSTTTSATTTIADGDTLYIGDLQTFTDKNVEVGKTYYYSIFSRDGRPNYSQPSTIFFKSTQGVASLLIGTEKIQAPTTAVTGGGSLAPSKLPILTGPFALGMKSEQVKVLQQTLIALGFLPQDIVIGYYGTLTVTAVAKFQEKHVLAWPGDEHYGFAGPVTRKKMNEIYGALTQGGGSGASSATETATSTVPAATSSPRTTDAAARERLIAEIKEKLLTTQTLLVELLKQLAEVVRGG